MSKSKYSQFDEKSQKLSPEEYVNFVHEAISSDEKFYALEEYRNNFWELFDLLNDYATSTSTDFRELKAFNRYFSQSKNSSKLFEAIDKIFFQGFSLSRMKSAKTILESFYQFAEEKIPEAKATAQKRLKYLQNPPHLFDQKELNPNEIAGAAAIAKANEDFCGEIFYLKKLFNQEIQKAGEARDKNFLTKFHERVEELASQGQCDAIALSLRTKSAELIAEKESYELVEVSNDLKRLFDCSLSVDATKYHIQILEELQKFPRQEEEKKWEQFGEYVDYLAQISQEMNEDLKAPENSGIFHITKDNAKFLSDRNASQENEAGAAEERQDSPSKRAKEEASSAAGRAEGKAPNTSALKPKGGFFKRLKNFLTPKSSAQPKSDGKEKLMPKEEKQKQ